MRFGFKNGYKGVEKTVLLKNVKLDDYVVTDHLWFNFTKGFQDCDLHEGDIVRFDGRVQVYEKGYKGYKEDVRIECPVSSDYKISRPSKVCVVFRAGLEECPI